MKSTMPHIPHLAGSRLGNNDLTATPEQEHLCRTQPVTIVEKMDGVGLTLGLDAFGALDVAMRMDWKQALGGRLLQGARRWLKVHEDVIAPLVQGGHQLHGEWVYLRLVIAYDLLTSAVVFHAVKDSQGQLLPRARSNALFRGHGLAVMEPHFTGLVGDHAWESLVPRRSCFGNVKPEGIIVERSDGKGAHWHKFVAGHYVQPRGKHVTGAVNGFAEGAVVTQHS